MKSIDEICIIVQARLSSQRCPNKMIRPFAGDTLTGIILKKLKKSKIIPINNVYLSVHEPELVSIGEQNGINIFHRSYESAMWDGGEGTHITGMYEWWDKLPYKYVIFINACAPLLTIETIDNFVENYLSSSSDGMFAVLEKKNYFWNKEGKLIVPWPEGEPCMNTKAVEVTREAAHCLYAGSMSKIGDGIWMGDFNNGEIELVSMPEEEAYDVDYEWEFELYEKFYKAKVKSDQ